MFIMTKNGWRALNAVCVNSNDLKGVFRPVSCGEAAAESVRRAVAYEKDVNRYINRQLPKEQIFRSFDTPIFGAFGEAL